MEGSSFEATIGSSAKSERQELPPFDWNDFVPEWIRKFREEESIASPHLEQLLALDAQMKNIAELAQEEGIDFRKMEDNSETSINLLVEAGVYKAEDAEFYRKQASIQNSPLMRMITWGEDNGIVTPEEAKELRRWYSPE